MVNMGERRRLQWCKNAMVYKRANQEVQIISVVAVVLLATFGSNISEAPCRWKSGRNKLLRKVRDRNRMVNVITNRIFIIGGTKMKKLIPSILLSLFSYPIAILFDFLIRITTHYDILGGMYLESVIFSLNITALIIALYVIHKSKNEEK